jgi:hypothetical protein
MKAHSRRESEDHRKDGTEQAQPIAYRAELFFHSNLHNSDFSFGGDPNWLHATLGQLESQATFSGLVDLFHSRHPPCH